MKYDKDITLCTIQRSEGNTFNSKKGKRGCQWAGICWNCFSWDGQQRGKNVHGQRVLIPNLWNCESPLFAIFSRISIFLFYLSVFGDYSLFPTQTYIPSHKHRERQREREKWGGEGWPSCTEIWAWGRLSAAVCITSLCLINIRNGSVE